MQNYTCPAGASTPATTNLSQLPGPSPVLARGADLDEGLFDSFDNMPQCFQCNDSGWVWRDWYGQGLQRECCPFCNEGQLRESEAAR